MRETSACSDYNVVVVGAGIAGLTAAFLLQREGYRVTVLESSTRDEVGGRMANVDHGGFPVDLAASLLSYRYQHLLRLAAAVNARPLRSSSLVGVVKEGRVQRINVKSLPRMAAGMLKLVPPTDAVRLLIDYARLRPSLSWEDMSSMSTHDHHSVSEYAARRGISNATVDYALDLLCILASLEDAEVTSSIGPFMILRSLLGGGGFFTSTAGVGFLPQALAEHVVVEHEATVLSVEESAGEVEVTWCRDNATTTVRAEACVIAVPPPLVHGIYPQLQEIERTAFESLRYAASIHIAFGLDRPTSAKEVVLDFPRKEHPDMCGFVLPHNMAEGRVAAGRGLAMAHFRGNWSASHLDSDDEFLAAAALAGARHLRVLPELESHAELLRVCRVPQGIVVRRPGDYRALKGLSAARPAESRVQLAGGDFLAHSTTNHSVASGMLAAQRIGRVLSTPIPARVR
ncbi:FAD-dependent oxidoreductase [Saccharopolyspora sp. NPDC050389]|uniref:protoporphyrinogen/coproporphyrinogen oxidase n=1 Tax=Saccharopolyspora sp. NPDC050389 TaxID=3155516 RepID=UPI003407EB6B